MTITGRAPDGGSGDVWAGTLEPAGEPCVVRLVRLPGDAARRRRAVAAARPLIELRHPHLVPVLAVSEVEDGLALVMEQVEEAVSLRRLIGARGRLEPGEVVTIGLPVAQALTAAHAAGLVHGSLGPADILLEPNGRPQLAGIGIGALGIPPPGPPDPGLVAPVDVFDLADLLLDLMAQATGPDAAAVAVAVATALVPDLARRPSAAELAANLAHSARPAPVQMISPPRPAAPDRGRDAQATTELYGLRRAPGAGSGGQDPGGQDLGSQDLGSQDPGGRARVGVPRARDAPEPDRSAGRASNVRPGLGPEPGEGAEPGHPGGRPDPDLGGDPGGLPADAAILEGDVVDRDAALLPVLPPDDGPVPLGDPDARHRPDRTRAGRQRPDGASPTRPRPGRSARPGSRPAGRGSGGHPPRQGSRGAQPGPRGWLLALTAGVGLTAVVVAVVLLNRPGPSGRPDVGTAVSAATGPTGGRSDVGTAVSAATGPTGGRSDVGTAVSAASGPTGGPPATARPTSASPAPDQAWRTLLAGLNTTRSRAFERDDESALAAVYQVGSALYVQDLQTLREVAGRGAHTSALTTHILDLQVRQQGTDQAVLRVTDQLDAYDFLSAAGTVLAHKDAEGPKRGDVTLVRTPDGWRISQRVPVA
ncbi:protein kinase [Frankia sp. AgB1.8]|uniref:protein kinase n=1 Tax=Frankia sp. AgB1.8 TaxID=2792839 RepID=UPI0019320DAE|nr:protein kinase [Frankia sp. AgB1.8]MBL7621539.1 protein kinase [Frankia sp. AgB1.8]